MSLRTTDNRARVLLEAAGVLVRVLSEEERQEAEQQWREVYGKAFRGRVRHGFRADFEYSLQPSCRWLMVPLSSGVEGASVSPLARDAEGCECEGPVVPLGVANDVEFAVAPADLSWTMLYTHEDHDLGGPYFVRREWVVDGG